MPPRPRFDRRAPVRELPNINDRISYPNLRVVDADGTQLGVISREEALEVALHQINCFPKAYPIVVPSGSCGAMMVRHYPELFEGHPLHSL